MTAEDVFDYEVGWEMLQRIRARILGLGLEGYEVVQGTINRMDEEFRQAHCLSTPASTFQQISDWRKGLPAPNVHAQAAEWMAS